MRIAGFTVLAYLSPILAMAVKHLVYDDQIAGSAARHSFSDGLYVTGELMTQNLGVFAQRYLNSLSIEVIIGEPVIDMEIGAADTDSCHLHQNVLPL